MKTKIFKKGDKVKYIKEPTKADWESIGEIPIPFKINDILEVYGQNMHSGSIYFKEKGFSYPNICFELYQETYKYEVVHTETQEQWIPQVGDWIYSNRLGCWYYSDCKHPVKIVEIKDDKFRYDLFSNTKTNRFKKGDISEYYGFSGIVRKAFPHEIPTQELSKEDLLAEAKRRYPVGTKYWNLNRAGGKSVPSNTIEELPVIGKNWKFEIADTDSIDGTDIIVVRDKEGMTHGWVYTKNTWAEIVEEPKIKSNKTVFDIEGYQQSDWSQVLHSTGKIIFEDGCAVKLVKNNKILPIKVRNGNITELTELPKRTRIKIIKKQLLII